MYTSRPFYMDKQRQDNQLEPTYSSSVPIRDVVLKTCRKQCTIEKSDKKGSGISVLMVLHDDDHVKLDYSNFLCLSVCLSHTQFISSISSANLIFCTLSFFSLPILNFSIHFDLSIYFSFSNHFNSLIYFKF